MTNIKKFIYLVSIAILLHIGSVNAADTQTLTAVPKQPLAPDFRLNDIDGKVYRLSDFRGKVVLINFWATWCPPCRTEMPSMQRAWEKLKGEDFMMLAINMGEDEDTIFGFGFAAGTELEFPILMDKEGSVTQEWPVLGLPTTFILDSKGRIRYRAVGGREWDDPALLQKIRALMHETKR